MHFILKFESIYNEYCVVDMFNSIEECYIKYQSFATSMKNRYGIVSRQHFMSTTNRYIYINLIMMNKIHIQYKNHYYSYEVEELNKCKNYILKTKLECIL